MSPQHISDQPVKRYFIHALMILLGLTAVVPIFVLLINSTRTTEQINTGITIVPGKDAFFSTTGTVIADWNSDDFPDIESGTAKYFDLIMGQTLRESVNPKTGVSEKRVVRAITETRLPRVTIFSEENQRLESYNLTNNAVILVNDGQRIKKGDLIARVIVPPNILYNWRALTGRGFQIWQGFGNSAIISICATLLSVYFSGLTAYGMHVYRFRGRTIIWLVILIIMMLPGSLTFIGFYQLMALWKLTDTYIPLIFPSIAAAATVLFIRQYMMSVLSMELIDAARIDGAGEYRIFNTIIIPVIIPALAAQSIFTFVGTWNNYITPSVIISSQSKSTLPMLIFSLRGDIYRTEYGGIYLGIAVSLIPIIIFYSLMSRFIISGITMGGIKE